MNLDPTITTGSVRQPMPWLFINFETGVVLRVLHGKVTNVANITPIASVRSVRAEVLERFRTTPNVYNKQQGQGVPQP